ncbi:flavin reductase family protein [Kaistia nematophila]|nr:flavin reductase family protein [Hyphomicrobiales bacterium]
MSLAAAYPYTANSDRFQAGVETAAFKNSMRFLAGAVSVITVGQGQDLTGFTATSVSSLSADHPSIIVSLNRASSSWPAIQRYQSFCVNVLADDQQHVADNFAGRGGLKGADRYEGASWQKLVTGSLGLVGALTVLDCELEEAIERHSHSILIGSVRAITTTAEAQPLLYWHGGYRQLSNETGPASR